MNIKTSKELLRFVFGRLRNQEGIEKGKLTTYMDDELIFKILINAKFKQEKNIPLTELENTVKKESGNYIGTYVGQKWEEAKSETIFNTPPFDDVANMTTGEILSRRLSGRIA